ncbi:hypothetical protein Btru_066571 [Bulinus truncatus]|nr:hypothetical protein Btru_066571 [Bulinus truncatus]
MAEINCIRKPVAERVTCPLSYSYSDVRRITALKVKERLSDLIKKQSREIDKQGRYCILNAKYVSYPANISLTNIKIVTSQWEDILRCTDLYGKRLLLYVFAKCPKVKALHHDLYTSLTMGAKVPDPRADQYARSVVHHMSCIIFNLNRAPVVESIIWSTFQGLRRHGHTSDMVKESSDAFLSFMQHYFSKRWSKANRDAWSKTMETVCRMGIKDWDSPTPIQGKSPSDTRVYKKCRMS